MHNISSNSLNLDQSIGEQVREQVRIAQEYDRYEEEQRQKLLSQQSPDNDELKRLVNKLHTEGIEKKSFQISIGTLINVLTIKNSQEYSFVFINRESA